MERIFILDAPVDVVCMRTALEYVDRRVSMQPLPPAYIVAANPEKVIALRSNAALRAWFGEAALIVPDGIGVVLAARWLLGKQIERVTGADLMEQICGLAAIKGYRIFVYGSSEDVNRNAVAELGRRYPSLNIAGRANGYVPAAEMPQLIKRINASRADILFVGLGSPRQEDWLRVNLPKLNVSVCQGIGGTLDTIGGTVKRAPLWMQSAGLEWFYRLLRQPSRIGRQLKLLRFVTEAVRRSIGVGPALDVGPSTSATLRGGLDCDSRSNEGSGSQGTASVDRFVF